MTKVRTEQEAIAAKHEADTRIEPDDPGEREQARQLLSYVCPLEWGELKPTGMERVFWCDHCRSHVRQAENLEEFRRLAAEGGCVALRVEIWRESGVTEYLKASALREPASDDEL